MRRPGRVKVIVYFPKNEEMQQELAARVAQVHAGSVIRRIEELGCPNEQKHRLLDAIIDAVKNRNREKEAEYSEEKRHK